MSECLRTFIIKSRLVKLGGNRIGFYIHARDKEKLMPYLGKEATLIVCIHLGEENVSYGK